MSALSFGDLTDELSRGTVRPSYLLAGSETLLRDDALYAIEDAVLGEGSRGARSSDWNYDRLDGDRAKPEQLDGALRTLPMMAERRLVCVREPGAKRGKNPLFDTLAEAVKELSEGGPVVLVVTAENADRRSAWTKGFSARVDCVSPKDRRAALTWITAEAKRQEASIDRGGAALLLERTGPHLQALRSEIAKCVLLASPKTQLSADLVRDAVADVAPEPIWDLTDAIGEGRTGDALAILIRLLEGGAPHPVVLGALAGHFRKLIRARHGEAIAGPPFVRKKLDTQAARYTPARLRTCLAAIHESDEILKGQGAVAPDMALERLVLGLAT